MKNILRNALFFALITLFYQCSEVELKESKKRISQNKNKVYMDIPKNKQTESYRKLKAKIEGLIGLSSLETLVNAEEIRVWFANSSLQEQLVILKKEKGEWQASIHTLRFNYDSLTNDLISIDKDVQIRVPKSGWKLFTDSLSTLKIDSLPDMSLINNYELGFDGRTITVEIAKMNVYRIYSYWEPNFNKDISKEAKQILLILALLENELNFKVL